MNAPLHTFADALMTRKIKKSFGKTEALKDVSLSVPAGSFIVLLGAAGAGKTTTLRIVAGLEDVDSGTVTLNGLDVDGIQPKDRDIAMIFDNLALYPNKTGFGNIANPLVIRGMDEQAIDDRVHEIAATLKISHILHRLPKTMSGGERQRVALGRALVREPKLFLMDEPLSSLDAMLRVELRAEMKRLQQEHGYSFLLATPDFQEALAVADKIVMLVEGRVMQTAEPREIYDRPAHWDVARFVGAPEINLIPAQVTGQGQSGRLELLGAAFPLPETFETGDAEIVVGVRPEQVVLSEGQTGPLTAEVLDIEPLGVNVAFTLSIAGTRIRATRPAAESTGIKTGMQLGADLRLDPLLAFDPETGYRID